MVLISLCIDVVSQVCSETARLAPAVTLLTCIQAGTPTTLTEVSHCFPPSLEENSRTVSQIWLATFFISNLLFIKSPYHPMPRQYEIMTVSLNKQQI
jgi:hypothetical protein